MNLKPPDAMNYFALQTDRLISFKIINFSSANKVILKAIQVQKNWSKWLHQYTDFNPFIKLAR